MPDFSSLGASNFETAGAVTASSTGTTVTGSVTADTKGAYAELIASTAYPAAWVIALVGKGAANDTFLVDIAVGAAGSEQIIIENIAHQPRAGVAQSLHSCVTLPIGIPAGSRISARAQSGVGGSDTVVVEVILIAPNMMSSNPMGAVTTYGADTATTSATSIDPGGTANTKGSYVEITSSTTYPINWIAFFTGNNALALAASLEWLIDIAVGAAASEQIIIANLWAYAGTSSDHANPYLCFPCSIPAGSRIAVRCQCSVNTATERLLHVIIHGCS